MKGWKSAAFLMGIVTLPLGILWTGRRTDSPQAQAAPHRRSDLASSLDGTKPFEGFLVSLPLEFHPGGLAREQESQVAHLARNLGEDADRETPQGLADRAAASLLLGDPDAAITLLEQAVSLAPRAGFLSDLAAAYLARAESGRGALMDRMRALSVVNRALQEDPDLREAVCNRALALEKLHLGYPAWFAWKACWQREETGAFGSEQISPHLLRTRPPSLGKVPQLRIELSNAALSGDASALQEIAAGFPLAAQKVAEEELKAWASRFLEKEYGGATTALLVAERIGEALRKNVGDRFIQDTVAAAKETSDPGALAHAFRDCGATPCLRAAQWELVTLRSPYQLRNLYLLGVSVAYQGKRVEGLQLLRRVEKASHEASYTGLLAESLWMIGLFEGDRGETERARQAITDSLEAFEVLRDTEKSAGARNVLAELLQDLGETDEAALHSQAALEQAAQILSPQTVYQIYTVAAMVAWRQGLPGAAIEFQNEAVRYASVMEPLAQCQALFWRSRFLRRLGRLDLARRDISEARRRAEQISDPSRRDRAESDLLLAEAEGAVDESSEASLALLDEALKRFSRLGHAVHLVDALLLRARSWRAVGDWAKAEADLRMAIERIETLRESILRPDLKVSFLEHACTAYDEMILLQGEVRKNPESALDFLERKRARALLESLLALSPDEAKEGERLSNARLPLSFRDWTKQLPAHTVLLSFARIQERILVWVVDRDGLRDFQILTGAAEMDAAAGRILAAARAGHATQAQIETDAAALHDALIRPVEAQIPAASRLVISRDDFLGGLPFGLLLDRRTGRFLVEDHTLSTVASANSYLVSLRRAKALESPGEERALFVGNPRFDRSSFPTLLDLPRSLREVEVSATFYRPNARILSGDQATVEAFLAGFDRYDLIQFSGHALVNMAKPLRSALLLSPSDARDGALRVHEIHGRRFQRARLLVLSACGSAEGPLSRSEGVQSLSQAFLAAGVPAVVGTLWDIPDEAGIELMTGFHRALRAGRDAASALRMAQVEALRSEDTSGRSPLIWAAFEVAGGTASQVR